MHSCTEATFAKHWMLKQNVIIKEEKKTPNITLMLCNDALITLTSD